MRQEVGNDRRLMVTLPLTVLAVALGTVGAVTVLRASRRGATTLAATIKGLFVAGVAILAGLVAVLGIAAATSLRMFGVMHYAYLAGTVSVPMVGAAGLVAAFRNWMAERRATESTSSEAEGEPRRSRWSGVGAGAVIAILLLPAPVGFYATHIEPLWLRVDHIDVALDPSRAGDDPVTIAVLSDLQTNRVGHHEREAVEAVMAAKPDVILIPGDLFHGNDDEFARELEPMRELLGRLRAPHGVYFVQGDAEPDKWLPRMIAGTDLQVLNADVVDLEIGDRRVRIGGHTLHPNAMDAHWVRKGLLDTTDPGVITILLAHRPDTALYLPADSRVDLTVAGHTHGGQIVVPGIGPLVTLSDIPRDVARGGLHRIDGNQIYVSPGVGVERGDAPQVRLFNRPAIAILTLR